MRILLAGLGSIGRRHLENVRALEPDAEIVVLRHDRRDRAVPSGADAVVWSLDDAIERCPEAAFVCGPASTHGVVGIALARAGAHLFIEKPLALDMASARAVVAACAAAGRTLAVGYNLRFDASLQVLYRALRAGDVGRVMSVRAEVGQYLPDWRAGVDYRHTASARAALGGGAALELSHEFDYVRWLCGEVRDVCAFAGRLSDLEIDVEDTVETLLRFEDGALASVHVDMAQRSAVRSCRIAGTAGTLLWDGIGKSVRRYRPLEGWHDVWTTRTVDRNETYRAEAADFFAAVRDGRPPSVDGTDGLRALEIALAARRSSAEARTVRLDKALAVS